MTLFLIVALGIGFWAMVTLGRRADARRQGWRQAAMTLGSLCLVGAAFSGARGGWIVGLVLGLAGSALISAALSGSFRAGPEGQGGGDTSSGMSRRQARVILGVGPKATEAEIQAAWKRLMARIHPDQGGSEGLASQLNAARDRLLKDQG